MNNCKVKYQFSIKSESELEQLSHEELLKYIKDLQKNITQEKPPKNSNNSSIPSSIEITNPKPKKNQSLRKKSDKKSGGQIGREGVTLKQSDTPDEIVPLAYTLILCKKCGFDLSGVVANLKEKRQVLDLKLSSIV